MAATKLTDLISDETRSLCDVIFGVVIHGFLGLFGSVANIINIMVFVKQGLTETVTISFLALSVADLCNLLPLVWSSVCSNPLFELKKQTENTAFVFMSSGIPLALMSSGIPLALMSSGIPAFPSECKLACLPHTMFLRCSFWIRVYINFERCCCIVFPIKVKMFFTKTKTVVVVACVYLLMLAFLVQGAACLQFRPTYSPIKNLTVFYVTIITSAACNIELSNLINVTARVVLFILDVIFTLIMIQRLQMKSKWRSNSSAGNTKSVPSLRDYRLIKMLVFISCMYISSSIPAIGYTVCLSYIDTLSGVNINFYSLIWSVAVSLEACGSSFNIFIFYTMSVRYKRSFLDLFARKFGPVKTDACRNGDFK
ncbi:uncharacterized protein LOC131937847 [Physella acuta]|uniref:uncharacterized protein LOC131937847 n=1 Tax=Physella acuta TaxID=109671 RepID=UPI0027DC3BB5|nr:uncharacterized protein LOC131937847 [Physella acuta]